MGEKKKHPNCIFLPPYYSLQYNVQIWLFLFLYSKTGDWKIPKNLWFAFSFDEFTPQKTLQIWKKKRRRHILPLHTRTQYISLEIPIAIIFSKPLGLISIFLFQINPNPSPAPQKVKALIQATFENPDEETSSASVHPQQILM